MLDQSVEVDSIGDATPAERLRRLIDSPTTVIVPGAFNALVARIFEHRGFGAVYVGGHGAAATFGLPDVGLLTQTEMTQHIERIASAVDIPVIADADEGYGDVINVVRTLKEFERAGAAGVQLEDQQMPKRCGHMEGKRLIPRDAMRRKIAAVVSSRASSHTVVIARTDAIGVTGIDDALERMEAYAAEGADVLFPDAPRSQAELETIASAINKPIIANLSEGGKTPLIELPELQRAGIRIALYPSSALFAAAYAAQQVASVLLARGTTASILKEMIVLDELNNLAGLPQWQQVEREFGS